MQMRSKISLAVHIALLAAMSSTIALVGCGQKGPLTLPTLPSGAAAASAACR
jgi:predicted small lipoprotein YifL